MRALTFVLCLVLAIPVAAVDVEVQLRVDPDRLAGADPEGRVRLYTPAEYQPGSSVSHWDVSATPNLLMEPSINSDLVFGSIDLTRQHLEDIGWPFGTSTVTLRVQDPPSMGFNDPELGDDRTAAMQLVADIYSGILGSDVEINIDVAFASMECGDDGAVLAGASAQFLFEGFEGAPMANTWYPGALAEALAGENLSLEDDINPDAGDISITFNSAIDAGCLGGDSAWSYATDGSAQPSTVSFVTVALHEIAHGLGFATFANSQFGTLFMGTPDIYNRFSLDLATGLHWDEMTTEQRRGSATNGQLVWDGPAVTARAPEVLGGSPILEVAAPDAISGPVDVQPAAFGPQLTETALTGRLAVIDDGSTQPTLGCEPATNPGELAGRIALIDRGTCAFVDKVRNAQDAGAIAAIIINNVPGPTPILGGTDPSITIPAVGITLEDGQLLRDVLSADEILDAGFIVGPNEPAIGELVQFTDTSAGEPTDWSWSFGDGATSNEPNPSHVYQLPGTYLVTLEVSDGTFTSSLTSEVVIGLGEPDTSVPAVARLSGSGGAFFTSRLELLNPADQPADVVGVYTPRGEGSAPQRIATATLAPRQMLTVDDPVQSWFGLDEGVGSLQIRGLGDAAGTILAQSVVSARNPDGTEFGQLFPASPTAAAIDAGDSAWLATTADGVRNRVNVGVMALLDGTVVQLAPVDPVGTELAPAESLQLDAGASDQLNNVAALFDLGDRAGFLIEARVQTGSALVYGSVLDGKGAVTGTSDPTTVLPVELGSDRVTLLEIGSIQGTNEFRGSATVSNLSATAAEVTAELYPRATPGAVDTVTFSLDAGATRPFTDLVGELFGRSEVGTVVLTTDDGAITATGREFAVYRDDGTITGTAGQLMRGLTASDLLQPELPYQLLGLVDRDAVAGRERSHLSVFNPGDEAVEVRLGRWDGASGVLEAEIVRTVRAGELIRINNVLLAIDPDLERPAKRVEITVSGPVHLAAFRVNGNGDPVTIEPLLVSGGTATQRAAASDR
jgi:PKD repeat protein